ncbi:MAG: hypothetical protein L3K19_09450 [Thermoplasmata archaeon]|nr:hypothetical protein [Thermoplasmata archaeon]
MSFSISDAANGLRNLFSQMVGGDVANNPHVLTRTFAKGLTLSLFVLGSDGKGNVVPVPGVSVAVQVQAQNPDGSWTTVGQYSVGPTPANGQVVVADSATVFDLTKLYQVLAQGSFPDGSSEDTSPLPFWPGSVGVNWGRGFSLNWLTTYVATTSTATVQGVSILAYPTSGNYPLIVRAVAYPAIQAQGLTYLWYSKSLGQAFISNTQSASFGFSATSTIYCVMTDAAGNTYTSGSIVITVNNAPPPASS